MEVLSNKDLYEHDMHLKTVIFLQNTMKNDNTILINSYSSLVSKYLRFKTILDILIAFNEKYYDITIKYQQSLQNCIEFIKLDKAN